MFRWLTPFEYCAVAGVIATLATWRDPVARIAYGEPSYTLGVLQSLAVFATTMLGARALFPRDPHFFMWQFFQSLGVATFAVPLVMGAQALAMLLHSMWSAAAGWLVVPLVALCYAGPRFGAFPHIRPRRQRWRILAPAIVVALILAIGTLLLPRPAPSDPYWKKFVPAEGAR